MKFATKLETLLKKELTVSLYIIKKYLKTKNFITYEAKSIKSFIMIRC